MRHVPHHVITNHAGERKHGKMAEELFWRDIGQPTKRMIASAINAYFRRGEAGFSGSFGAGAALGAACGCAETRIGGAGRNVAVANHRHATDHDIVKIHVNIAVFLFAQQLQQVNEVGAIKLG